MWITLSDVIAEIFDKDLFVQLPVRHIDVCDSDQEIIFAKEYEF
jgi:hypothetical protein